ncbi:MAG TPA: hypothetical protein VEX18_06235 [Polyangiaceae bacterium]|nr:hypothetical protein [Polyangiaceae bacterium]
MPAVAAAPSVPAPTPTELFARSAHSAERDPARAIGALSEQLAAGDANAVLLFCSAGYDLERLVRRLELEARGVDQQVGELLASRRAVGFSCYGEQLGPLHANHTLTGLALGSARPGALS